MILYDWKIGLTYKDSHTRLVQAWGDQAPSDRTVLNWFHEFQRNNFSVEDAARPGRPRTSVNEQTIDAARVIIEDDPHSTYGQIQYVLGISSPASNSIIHDYLFKVTQSLHSMGAPPANWWSKKAMCSILSPITEKIWRRSISSCIWHYNWWWILVLSLRSENKGTIQSLGVKSWSTSNQGSSKQKVKRDETRWFLSFFD